MLPRVNLVRTDNTDYLLFSTNDAITRTIEANGFWAPLLIEIAMAFCDGIENAMVIDVGANLGAFSIPLAQKIEAAGGLVFAYEPQRIIFYQLCGNIFLNRIENIHAFHAAIGSTTGHVDIPNLQYENCLNIGGFTMSDLAKTVFQVEAKEGSNVTDMLRLDDISVPRAPHLIKIDVEGFELDVLTGARELIARSSFPPHAA